MRVKQSLDKLFQLSAHGSNVRTEFLAGFTTFLTMSYVIFVIPAMLSKAGMPAGAVFTATCLASIVGCAVVGLLANLPIAIAPGLTLNAYFAYMIVLTLGYSWQTALGFVLIAGIIFMLLSILRVRQWLVNALPTSIITATSAGLGLFIGMIALKDAGIIISNKSTLLALGNLGTFSAIMALIGFYLIAMLDHYRVTGSIIIVIAFIAIVSLIAGKSHFAGIVSAPPNIAPTFGAANFKELFNPHGLIIIFTFVMIALFDSSGALIGILNSTKLLEHKEGKKKLSRALAADSIATVAAAIFGTSTTATFIESSSGVRAGGRTGLTSLVTAGFFVFALFLSPLAKLIPGFASTPALLFIACMMLKDMKNIIWDDLSEAIPSAITMIMIPFSFSIANGIGLGFISYVVIKVFCGRAKEIKPALYILAAVFVLYFARQVLL